MLRGQGLLWEPQGPEDWVRPQQGGKAQVGAALGQWEVGALWSLRVWGHLLEYAEMGRATAFSSGTEGGEVLFIVHSREDSGYRGHLRS